MNKHKMLDTDYDVDAKESFAVEAVDSKTQHFMKIDSQGLLDLCDVAQGAALVLGFARASSDFTALAASIRRQLPLKTDFLLISSETGGLCRNEGETDLYQSGCVILQSFSRRMIKELQVLSLPMPDEDIRKGRVDMTVEQRVEKIRRSLQRQVLHFPVRLEDTVALTYVDGLSACENFAVQAMYESQRFPCLLVGGSAGADKARRRTYIYNGTRVLEKNLVVCLLKLKPGYRAAAFYSNNVGRMVAKYTILDANSTLQTVHKVADEQGKCSDLTETLKRQFHCLDLKELKQTLKNYVFGVEIDGRIYTRDLRHIGEAHNCLYFHCGFSAGETLFLFEKGDLQKNIHKNWGQFTKNKPYPFAGLLHECSHHFKPQNHKKDLCKLFQDVVVSGFSCRGEILGVPMNESFAGVFFFAVKGQRFLDKCLDSFPVRYASFSNYFALRRLKHIQIINDLSRKADEIIARQQWNVQVGSSSEADVVEEFSKVLDDFNTEKVFDYKNEQKMRQTINAIRNGSMDKPNGEIGTLVSYMQTMINRLHNQRHILEKKMEQMEKSVHFYARDELTGTYSRRSGFELIRQVIEFPKGIADFMTLVFIDIDNLKTANDIWGHEEGDFYLRTVVELLTASLCEPDIICRYGGDEFLIVLLNQQEAGAESLLKRINEQLKEISLRRQKGYKMSFSFGTMFYDYSRTLDLDEAISHMDAKMYGYKETRAENLRAQQRMW